MAPENAPDSTPISVMPICTVERNFPGSEASASARREPRDAFLDQPGQPRRPRRDDRQFRHREQAIDDDQDRDDRKFQIEHASTFSIGHPLAD